MCPLLNNETFNKCYSRLTFYKDMYSTTTHLSDCSPGRGIWGGLGRSSKSGQGMKSLISTFACFLTAITKVFFPEVRLGAGLYLHPNLGFS